MADAPYLLLDLNLGTLDDPSMERGLANFRELLTRAMVGFLRRATPGEWIGFAPELLPARIEYARRHRIHGEWREESDRWQEALRLYTAARASFAEAQRRVQAASKAGAG